MCCKPCAVRSSHSVVVAGVEVTRVMVECYNPGVKQVGYHHASFSSHPCDSASDGTRASHFRDGRLTSRDKVVVMALC